MRFSLHRFRCSLISPHKWMWCLYIFIFMAIIYSFVFIHSLVQSRFLGFPNILIIPRVESLTVGTLILNLIRLWVDIMVLFIRNYFSLSLTIFTSLSPSPSPFMCMNLDLIRIATEWILCKMKYGLNIYNYCSAHEQKQRYKNRQWITFFVVVWFCFTFNTATATYTSFGILNDTLNSVLNRNIL